MTITFWDPDGSVFMSIEGMSTPTQQLNKDDFRNCAIKLMMDMREKPTETEALLAEHFDMFLQE